MTVDSQIVKLRLDKILTILQRIEFIHESSKEEFLSDLTLQSATERNLQVVAQAIIDICTHLVAHNHWGTPKSYSDAVFLVARNGVIPESLAERLIGLVKLRNVIVHLYLDTDPTIVYESARLILEDGKEFVDCILTLLNS